MGSNELRFSLPDQTRLSVGRDGTNDLVLQDPTVSRLHAWLTANSGSRSCRAEDRGSANGTHVCPQSNSLSDTLVQRHGGDLEFKVGDCVAFGTQKLVLRETEVGSAPAPHPTAWLSEVMDSRVRHTYELAQRAAKSMLSVLILGESGVGKEVLAEHIHQNSLRHSGPFLKLNCAALPEQLLESELFGHEKGSFTGAVQARAGLLEMAEGGTVLLDEVSELSLPSQAKLLRVLEDRRLIRVGGRAYRNIDVRFIAASNRDLGQESEDGRFRRDLYYRLSVVELPLPPLRERRSEIVPLAEFLIDRACAQQNREHPPRLTDAAARLLSEYDWPGNVRELRNALERAIVLAQNARVIGVADIPERILSNNKRTTPPAAPAESDGMPNTHLRELERLHIIRMLDNCGGNQTKTAEGLGISRSTLIKRLDDYKLPRPRRQ